MVGQTGQKQTPDSFNTNEGFKKKCQTYFLYFYIYYIYIYVCILYIYVCVCVCVYLVLYLNPVLYVLSILDKRNHIWHYTSDENQKHIIIEHMCFPTCQVTVVRFYQSPCPPLPPPPPPPPSPPPPPRLAVLLPLLLASASSTSTSTLPTLPTRRQALHQLPSSVRTAGCQPASCPAKCAPLNLN